MVAEVWSRERRGITALRWLALAVVAYAGVAAVIAPRYFQALLSNYLYQMAHMPIFMLIALPLVGVAFARHAPLRFAGTVLAERWRDAAVVAGAFCLGMAAFTSYKLAIPRLVPFYADPFLADLDEALHFGVPGMMLHQLVPAWAEYPIAYIYSNPWMLLWFGMVLTAAFMTPSGLRTRYLWTLALTTAIVGTVLATALSSVGPIFYAEFYGEDRFAPLMALVADSPAGDHLDKVSAYLLLNYQADGHLPGTGISAMPSMHVAIVTLNALFISRLSRGWGVAAWLFAAAIMIGSVYLSWHYAIDGYLSIAVVLAVWWATGRVFERPARD